MTRASDPLPLFVYGTLMSGQPAHERLAASVLRCERARLNGATLHVVSWYPMAAPGTGTVHGELLWLMEEGYGELLAALDDYESDAYARVVQPVSLAGGQSVPCWVYLAPVATASRYPRLADGDWRIYLQQTGIDDRGQPL